MKQTVAVTVFVDVEVSKGGRAACMREAKSMIQVGTKFCMSGVRVGPSTRKRMATIAE